VGWEWGVLVGCLVCFFFMNEFFFLQGEIRKTIALQVLRDDTPEVNEEYLLKLSNISTEGMYDKAFKAA
jgi:hypothetical protein